MASMKQKVGSTTSGTKNKTCTMVFEMKLK